MAMTFTIASMAREALTTLIEDRITREREEDERKTRAYEEVGHPHLPNTPSIAKLMVSRPSWRGHAGRH